MEPFGMRLAAAAAARQSVVCVGLDPRPDSLPRCLWRATSPGSSGSAQASLRFCLGIIDAVAEHAVAIKPQLACFEALGWRGMQALEQVCAHARRQGLLVIVDAKRGDIAESAEAYASAWLRGRDGAPALGDALTVNPYLGPDTLAPFVRACEETGAGLFVLARTSNPGSGELQLRETGGEPLWERVARLVDGLDASTLAVSAIGAVVGATYPSEVRRARELMPRAPLLLPGVGAQGGSVAALAPAFSIGPGGGLVSASRSVIYASSGDDWQQAAAHAAAEIQAASWQLVPR